ncbi:hypothetical protein OUZ56_027766 [Daphnia magna]|uniref:Uncharacterized protein n=1 Tax=Daphnia magna TaxID=35525 RepID=A0ABR0B1X5_9CRUS|nr:hypothetical protein OUZ56_027766 [Daphnia magna]
MIADSPFIIVLAPDDRGELVTSHGRQPNDFHILGIVVLRLLLEMMGDLYIQHPHIFDQIICSQQAPIEELLPSGSRESDCRKSSGGFRQQRIVAEQKTCFIFTSPVIREPGPQRREGKGSGWTQALLTRYNRSGEGYPTDPIVSIFDALPGLHIGTQTNQQDKP